MPFKTKKRKIIADTRKISLSEQGLASYASSEKNGGQIKDTIVKREKSSDNLVEGKYSYVKKEVIKITIFGLLIIGLQIILKISNITS